MKALPVGMPRKIGKYNLLAQLGAGGMGEVYLAESGGAGGLTKRVAMKVMLPSYSADKEMLKYFRGEAEIAIQLHHNNVASMYEYGMHYTRVYMVMEYINGLPLKTIREEMIQQEDSFSIAESAHIAREVAAGLDYIHRAKDQNSGKPLGLVHRDVSPHNIMINIEGEIKIIDFGIAKSASHAESSKGNPVFGKLRYMSQEHAKGLRVTPQSDIFSLGVVLWELLAQVKIYDGLSDTEIIGCIVNNQFPPLPEDRFIPKELCEIVERATAHDVKKRYAFAEDMYRDLNTFLATHYPQFSQKDFSRRIQSFGFMQTRKTTDLTPGPNFYTTSNELPNNNLPRALPNTGLGMSRSARLTIFFLFILGTVSFGITQMWSMNLLARRQLFAARTTKSSHAHAENTANAPSIRLKVSSQPSGASIEIDGQPTGYSTPTWVPVNLSNPVKIGLYLNGYQPCFGELDSKSLKFQCQLERK